MNSDHPHVDFRPFKRTPKLVPGLVLAIDSNTGTTRRYLRLTHVFANCVYAMDVGTPDQARYAKQPFRISLGHLQDWAPKPESWGQIPLPREFTTEADVAGKDSGSKDPGSDARLLLKKLRPLLNTLKGEESLDRKHFPRLIKDFSNQHKLSTVSLRRIVLRYWYFGQTDAALRPLTRGPKVGRARPSHVSIEDGSATAPPKRRGRQPRIAKALGANTFVVLQEDVDDMLEALKKILKKGPAEISDAHDFYLENYFAKRHPDIFQEYLDKKRPEPVTIRQFRYYAPQIEIEDPALAKKLKKYKRHKLPTGAVRAEGPAEIYEIDATVQRIFLISKDDGTILAQPTLYVVIDRWSRYIVSVYISLKSPSWDEVKYALLVAFTPRQPRFSRLEIDTNDQRWPPGKPPAAVCVDRGAEFRSESIERALADNLRIEIMLLPPRTPDGKAVVERVIRELKKRNAHTRMKGSYANRQEDHDTRKLAKKAKAVAVYNLTEIYQETIRQVESYNNKPHKTLKDMAILAREGVAPCPKDAYLWGMTHSSGTQTPPLSDADYQRMLLGVDKATLTANVLRYRSQIYVPVNQSAQDIAKRSSRYAKSKTVRVDRSDPTYIYIDSPNTEWAQWELSEGSKRNIRGIPLDELELHHEEHLQISDVAENSARVADLKRGRTKQAKAGTRQTDNKPLVKKLRNEETKAVKDALKGKTSNSPSPDKSPRSKERAPERWEVLEEERRQRLIKIIARNAKPK